MPSLFGMHQLLDVDVLLDVQSWCRNTKDFQFSVQLGHQENKTAALFNIPRQWTPALSLLPQLWVSLCGQSNNDNSSPLHCTSSSQYCTSSSFSNIPLRYDPAAE